MSEARGLILPGTGRGTIRRMVEGLIPTHSAAWTAPSTSYAGPPPRPGEE